jgi:alkanesulfonate monooxygenase SsuD/methylene tetrahydromethanopterin reductase-like flavin-dependent oxidoreductase (luciferase family)
VRAFRPHRLVPDAYRHGRRLDAALRVLPDLIAGRPARLSPDEPEFQLSPGAAVPPIIVGGLSDRAFDRAIANGDGV